MLCSSYQLQKLFKCLSELTEGSKKHDEDQDYDEVEVDDTIEEPNKVFTLEQKPLKFVGGNGNFLQNPAHVFPLVNQYSTFHGVCSSNSFPCFTEASSQTVTVPVQTIEHPEAN